VIPCAFCGRENEPDSRFCIDCGKPANPSAARIGPAYVPSPSGDHALPVTPPTATARSTASSAAATSVATPAVMPPSQMRSSSVPITRVSEAVTVCASCGKSVSPELPFCGHCGTRVGQRASVGAAPATSSGTQVLSGRRAGTTRIALLGEAAQVVQTFTLERDDAVIGRGEADIRFENDLYMSPLHVRLELRNGQLALRDLGSRNGTWVFIDRPTKLTNGDVILMGSQLLRFRRLGYPGPHPPEADSTRRMGSAVPNVDIAVLEQLRADGSVRDTFHLSPGRSVTIGRETGDWTFPYDGTMSSRHTEIRSEDNEFFVHDANSRNGVAMAARGERPIQKGQRLLVGDQILRVESV